MDYSEITEKIKTLITEEVKKDTEVSLGNEYVQFIYDLSIINNTDKE